MIKSYISGIKSVLRNDGIILNEDAYLINAITRSCRLVNDHMRIRLLIKQGMLYVLLKQLETIFQDQPYLEILYKTLFLTAYFGLLRVGEITRGNHPVSVKDVHIADNKEKVLFTLRSLKTHNKDVPPQEVTIESSKFNPYLFHKSVKHLAHNRFCPYYLLRQYIAHRPNCLVNTKQFFVFSDRSAVTSDHMRKKLKHTLRAAGFDSNMYDTHSYRIGRAVDLRIKHKISIEAIRFIGRWKSSAIYNYLRFVS